MVNPEVAAIAVMSLVMAGLFNVSARSGDGGMTLVFQMLTILRLGTTAEPAVIPSKLGHCVWKARAHCRVIVLDPSAIEEVPPIFTSHSALSSNSMVSALASRTLM